MHQTGLSFIVSLIHRKKPDYDAINIKTVIVKRQVKRLDILIEVNEDAGNILAILIEDKTYTDHHHGQLDTHYENAIKTYSPEQIVAIYLKTGYASKANKLGEFKTYLRSDFLKILKIGKTNGVCNAIYDDFLQHLQQIEEAISGFYNKLGWNREDWIGFYTNIMENRNDVKLTLDEASNYEPVYNKTRGNMLFWWYFKKLEKYTVYIQLKDHRVTFRIRDVSNSTDWREACADCLQKIYCAATKSGVDVQKTRWKQGESMAVAELTIKDYRIFNNGMLEINDTLNTLIKAERLIDSVASL